MVLGAGKKAGAFGGLISLIAEFDSQSRYYLYQGKENAMGIIDKFMNAVGINRSGFHRPEGYPSYTEQETDSIRESIGDALETRKTTLGIDTEPKPAPIQYSARLVRDHAKIYVLKVLLDTGECYMVGMNNNLTARAHMDTVFPHAQYSSWASMVDLIPSECFIDMSALEVMCESRPVESEVDHA